MSGYGAPRSDSDYSDDEPPPKLWAHLGQGDPAVAKRERVLVEIMDTEEAYINDLKNCIQFVIDPLDIQSQTRCVRCRQVRWLPRGCLRCCGACRRCAYICICAY